jgi:hypothetical protein
MQSQLLVLLLAYIRVRAVVQETVYAFDERVLAGELQSAHVSAIVGIELVHNKQE